MTTTSGIPTIINRANRAEQHGRLGNATNALEELAGAQLALTGAIVAQVAAARAQGASWNVIGDCLDITKQAAAQRFSKHPVVLAAEAQAREAARDAQTAIRATSVGQQLVVEHVPGQLELPTNEEATPVDAQPATEVPWVCRNCGTDTFAQVDLRDPQSWCSRCHVADNPEELRAAQTCGHCGMGRHQQCQFDPRSKTYLAAKLADAYYERGPLNVTIPSDDKQKHWQCPCSFTH